MIHALLRTFGFEPTEPAGPDDQTYSEAAMDNAIVDADRTVDRLAQVAAHGTRANDLLRASIERLKISSADPLEVMARVSRRSPDEH